MYKLLLTIVGFCFLLFGWGFAQTTVVDSSQDFLDRYNKNLLTSLQKDQQKTQIYNLDSQLTTICDNLIEATMLTGGSTGFGQDFGRVQPRSSIFLLYVCRRANPKGSNQYFTKSFPLIIQLDQKEISKEMIEKLTDKQTLEKVGDCFDADLQNRFQKCPIVDFLSVILRIVQSQQQLSLYTANVGGDGTLVTTPTTMKNYSPQRFFFKNFHTFPGQLELVYQKGYEGKNVEKKQIVSEWVKQQITAQCGGGLNPFSSEKSYRGDKVATLCSAPNSLSEHQQYLSQINKNWNKKNMIFSTKIFDEGCTDPILSGQTHLFQCAYELGDPRLESNVLLNEYMNYKIVIGSLQGIYQSKPDTITNVSICKLYSDIQGPSVKDKLNRFSACSQSYDQLSKKVMKQSLEFYFQQKNAVIAQYFISVITEKIADFNNNYFYKLMLDMRKLLRCVGQPKGSNVYNRNCS